MIASGADPMPKGVISRRTPGLVDDQLPVYWKTTDSSFTVAKRGTDVRREFRDLQAALDFAPGIVDVKTPIRFFAERG